MDLEVGSARRSAAARPAGNACGAAVGRGRPSEMPHPGDPWRTKPRDDGRERGARGPQIRERHLDAHRRGWPQRPGRPTTRAGGDAARVPHGVDGHRARLVSVSLAVDDRRVATLTISRPQQRNAIDAAVRSAMVRCLAELPGDVRCVVLRGEGPTFCAGADIDAMRASVEQSWDENVRDAQAIASMFAALDELPMPLIARVQGAAIGGGAGLVAVADIAVATRDTTFAFSEVRLGILPALIAPYVVRKCGPAFATGAFTT